LRGHQTKEGVWAKIVVLRGAVAAIRMLEPEVEEVMLFPRHAGFVEQPAMRCMQVKPKGA